MEKTSLFLFVLAISGASARDVNRRQLRPSHCDTLCDDEGVSQFNSVCGTDGVIYTSKCDYNNAACKSHETGDLLLYSSIGPECVTTSTTCDVMQHTTCVGLPPNPSVPAGVVCGTDGHTYGSMCNLMKAKCANPSSHLEVDHDGVCELKLGNNSRMVNCSQYVIDLGGLALEGGSHLTLRVRPCPKIFKPVCGIDGRTYSNECTFCGTLAMRHAIQAGHLTVPIEHDGICVHSIIG